MPDSNTDGRTRVQSVPSIANINAPTVAELNAGTDLSGLMTPDGLVGFEADTSDVDNSKLNSTFDTKTPGRIGYSGTLVRMVKQEGTDTVYNTMVYDYATHIVIRRDMAAGTGFAASQKVEVYPVRCGQVRDLAPEGNSVHKYEIPLKITTQPQPRATVA